MELTASFNKYIRAGRKISSELYSPHLIVSRVFVHAILMHPVLKYSVYHIFTGKLSQNRLQFKK
jgi:hypothetical protein